MNILHTADWHLGKRLLSEYREQEHQLFIDWLLNQIEQQEIDVLLISGDIFDVTNPPNYARKMYFDFLSNVAKSKCRNVIIVGGNHDSVTTLDAPRDVFKLLDIYIVGGARESIEEEVITIKDSEGNMQLVIGAVPFLRDSDIRISRAGESHDERIEATKQGIIQHYEKVYELAKEYKKPIIAMGHLFATGARTSESERDIHIGNLGSVTVDDLPSFDYVALGHLHRPQKLGGDEMVRYSGSPIHLSFSERDDQKSVCLLKLEQDQLSFKECLSVPNFRKLLRFKGTFEEVNESLENYQPDSELVEWAELVVTSENPDPSLSLKLQTLKEETEKVLILKYKIEVKNQIRGVDELGEGAKSIQELEPIDVFDKLLEKQSTDDKELIKNAFQELYDSFLQQDQE